MSVYRLYGTGLYGGGRKPLPEPARPDYESAMRLAVEIAHTWQPIVARRRAIEIREEPR